MFYLSANGMKATFDHTHAQAYSQKLVRQMHTSLEHLTHWGAILYTKTTSPPWSTHW